MKKPEEVHITMHDKTPSTDTTLLGMTRALEVLRDAGFKNFLVAVEDDHAVGIKGETDGQFLLQALTRLKESFLFSLLEHNKGDLGRTLEMFKSAERNSLFEALRGTEEYLRRQGK